MNYHVKWINADGTLGKEVVEKLNLGVFIVGLTNDECVIIQVEPI